MSEQKRLDRPELREKIISLIEETTTFTEGEYSPLAGPLTSDLREMDCEPSYLADQIFALIPDEKEYGEQYAKSYQEAHREILEASIEEAKKQERERIRKQIMDMYDGSFPEPYNEAIRRMWQALKGE